MYAGHFQRFIQNFLNLQLFTDNFKILQIIIPFLINNCNILAYQQLLTSILSDFSLNVNKKLIYDSIEQMLKQLDLLEKQIIIIKGLNISVQETFLEKKKKTAN